MAASLAEANRRKSKFIATRAHEIRNPLRHDQPPNPATRRRRRRRASIDPGRLESIEQRGQFTRGGRINLDVNRERRDVIVSITDTGIGIDARARFPHLRHEVRIVYDGREAIAVGGEFLPDATVMDIGRRKTKDAGVDYHLIKPADIYHLCHVLSRVR